MRLAMVVILGDRDDVSSAREGCWSPVLAQVSTVFVGATDPGRLLVYGGDLVGEGGMIRPQGWFGRCQRGDQGRGVVVAERRVQGVEAVALQGVLRQERAYLAGEPTQAGGVLPGPSGDCSVTGARVPSCLDALLAGGVGFLAGMRIEPQVATFGGLPTGQAQR
jgi:hypothetical protein